MTWLPQFAAVPWGGWSDAVVEEEPVFIGVWTSVIMVILVLAVLLPHRRVRG